MRTHAWVIGAGGLLGGAVVRSLRRRDGWVHAPWPGLPWTRPAEVASTARRFTEGLIDLVAPGERWCVIWTAGAGVTSSTSAALDLELEQFSEILDAIGSVVTSRGAEATGAVFYSSSAGGAYGGSDDPPFDEFSSAVPLSDYGRFKLAAEGLLRAFSQENNVSVAAGRIANIYGPGQKLGKMQGLISHLAKAQFSPSPASIFVPLETMRDYIFVDDCADLILDVLDRVAKETHLTGRVEVMKILASGNAVTIGQLLGHFRMLAKGHPHVRLGSSPFASMQGLDLRLTSRVWPELDHRQLTPLPAGISATMGDMLRQIQTRAL